MAKYSRSWSSPTKRTHLTREVTVLDIRRVLAAKPRKHDKQEPRALLTPWGENLDPESILQEHPRPQFAREGIRILNGRWDYALQLNEHADVMWRTAQPPTEWDGQILVPFSPEAPLSGVGEMVGWLELLWYRLHFSAPAAPAGQHVILHFDGVDFACSCYLNGVKLGEHMGAYMPFEFDITDALTPGEKTNELLVCVWDPSDTGTQLRGKQRIDCSDIWYTAQSGIWKTVWLETAPSQRIASISLEPNLETGEITVRADVTEGGQALQLDWVGEDGRALQNAQPAPAYLTPGGTFACTARLPLDAPRLWSLEDPYLYTLRLTYGQDQVNTYCAFRTAEVRPDQHGVPRFHLNGKPLLLRGVLDQGYWPDGLMTPPSDQALISDIQAAKDLGFNMLRKHIKIESDRWYYHADRLGMLVWQDMPTGGGCYDPWTTSYKPTLFRKSWGAYSDEKAGHLKNLSSDCASYRAEWTATCKDMVTRLKHHPCIVTWALFNEAWGQFLARRMTDMVRTLDPTRPVDAVSGWYDQNCGEYLSVHNYFRPLEVYPDTARERLIARNAPGTVPRRAFAISEFGGLTLPVPGHTMYGEAYGYEAATNAQAFQAAVREQLAQVDALEAHGLAGYVYTQLSDVEEEVNGLLTYDRRVNKMG